MKAAFNIPPSSAENSSLHLLVEAGSYGISFLWFTNNPVSVKGLAVYNFLLTGQATDIPGIFRSQEMFLSGLASTTICYDFKESLLIPGKFIHSSLKEAALSLLYGDENDAILNNDLITSAHIYNQYRIPKNIGMAFNNQFPNANIFHSTSQQVERFNEETELLYCIFFNDVLKVILYKEQKLQIVQQFNYTSPVDVAYHLLNVCEQHNVKPSEIPLRLSGMIDEHSKLYQEIYQYFLNISFENIPEEVNLTQDIKAFPQHFFSHLTALALCVS